MDKEDFLDFDFYKYTTVMIFFAIPFMIFVIIRDYDNMAEMKKLTAELTDNLFINSIGNDILKFYIMFLISIQIWHWFCI